MGLIPFLVPLHNIEMVSGLVSGEVVVGVRSEFPIDGVDMILGNDLAGDCMWPDDHVCSTAEYPPVMSPSQPLESMSESEVFPACAVSHAMSCANSDTAQEKIEVTPPVLFIPVALQSISHSDLVIRTLP